MANDLLGPMGREPKKPRVRKAEPDGTGHARVMALYFAEHERRFGCKPMSPGKVGGKILKDLLADLGERDLAAVVHEFIWTRDRRVAGCGYTLKDLRYHAPRLRLQLNGHREQDPRTADNVTAASRATGRDRT